MRTLSNFFQISDYLFEVLLMDNFNEKTEIRENNDSIELLNGTNKLKDMRVKITCPTFLENYHKAFKNHLHILQHKPIIVLNIQNLSYNFHKYFLGNDLSYYLENELKSIQINLDFYCNRTTAFGGSNHEFYIMLQHGKISLYTLKTTNDTSLPNTIQYERIWSELLIPTVFSTLQTSFKTGTPIKYDKSETKFFMKCIRSSKINKLIQ